MKILHFATLALALFSIFSCALQAPVEGADNLGTVAMPLKAAGPSGAIYRLKSTAISIYNEIDILEATLRARDFPTDANSIDVELAPGSYYGVLEDGWQIVLESTGERVEAELASPAVVHFEIDSAELTPISYQFNAGDGIIPFDDGLQIDFEVNDAACGNGVIQDLEECDGNDLGSETCATLGHGSGALSCAYDCTFVTTACTPNFLSVAFESGDILTQQDNEWSTRSETPNGTATWGAFGSIYHSAGGGIFQYVDSTWNEMAHTYPTHSFSVLSFDGHAADDLYAGTTTNGILHYDGTAWNVEAGTQELYIVSNIWASPDGYVFATGISESSDGRVFFKAPGSWWTEMTEIPIHAKATALWGTSSTNVYVGNEQGQLLHWNGQSWRQLNVPTTGEIHHIWGSSPIDIYVVGGNRPNSEGMILHFNGIEWVNLGSPAERLIYYVWGRASDDLYFVATDERYSEIYHFDGANWSFQNSIIGYLPTGIWGN